MAEEEIEKIKEEVKEYFKDMPPSHDWSHVERVYSLSQKIGEMEGANLYIIKLAALLHDIGRKEEMESGGDHTEISTRKAIEILKKYKINEETASQILHCISSHRFRNNHKPKTIEAKVLFDADKLDCIGAVGIARSYAWCGEQKLKLYSDKNFLGTGYEKEHSPLTEFLFKLSKIKDKMQTETGKKIALEKHEYTEDFFNKLKEEVEFK